MTWAIYVSRSKWPVELLDTSRNRSVMYAGVRSTTTSLTPLPDFRRQEIWASQFHFLDSAGLVLGDQSSMRVGLQSWKSTRCHCQTPTRGGQFTRIRNVTHSQWRSLSRVFSLLWPFPLYECHSQCVSDIRLVFVSPTNTECTLLSYLDNESQEGRWHLFPVHQVWYLPVWIRMQVRS